MLFQAVENAHIFEQNCFPVKLEIFSQFVLKLSRTFGKRKWLNNSDIIRSISTESFGYSGKQMIRYHLISFLIDNFHDLYTTNYSLESYARFCMTQNMISSTHSWITDHRK